MNPVPEAGRLCPRSGALVERSVPFGEDGPGRREGSRQRCRQVTGMSLHHGEFFQKNRKLAPKKMACVTR